MSERYKNSEEMLDKALKVIPVGTQTFSKSKTQYPHNVSPYYIERGEGSHVWDIDGNEYIDYVNALASVTLGYCNPDVDRAVLAQLKNGVTFTLPHKLEIEVAELLVELIPCAEMVRFGKNGTDVTSAAVRLSRAYTGREHILVCGYHGWQDWYIGSTSRDLGVPENTKSLTHIFNYNDMDSIERHFDAYPEKIAAVIMEPMNAYWPENDFLNKVKILTHKNGALLVFDETITGCRYSKGGAQELFKVTPDLATFGKGLGNGFPISAIVGKREIMEGMEDIFFSGTFGGETLSLAAAKCVLTKVRDEDVIDKIHRTGKKIIENVKSLISNYNLDKYIKISGHPSWSILSFLDADKYTSWEIKTLFLQEVFKRGILVIGSHNVSYAHSDTDINLLIECYEQVFPILNDAIVNDNLYSKLETTPLEPLFKIR